MIGLIDGDVVAYRAAYLAQGGDDQDVRDLVQAIASTWVEEAGADSCVVCLGSKPTFRHRIFDQYKANRGEKPEMLPACIAALEELFVCLRMPDLEADDALGILATGKYKGRSVIISIDKDLLQIPGSHYNPDKERHTIVSDEDGFYLLCQQWLSGDTVDNFKGVPRVGEKTAKKLLGDSPSLERVKEVYDEKDLDHDYFLLQGRLARILTADNCDDPESWEPELKPSTRSENIEC
tara:strand:+ start:768 stop:1475 length:708 start_codon:yes stop_codon:yes gene_type:complete